ncbi:MAG: protein-glutamate O-methyltransferase CheR [Armatimonadota bacterium]|nr:protein-glutamate O-methyltransferase CheR [Armatimonadota bacterium]MDR7439015.1 protein-glutamate O-methyltransferase CheR [Armatimonadota bacterium]MDR7563611.1 protein-glutamate O-methyltransferase CheR [Armatimonadota bacterium]MDR7566859.1 protein-glutamate O-methyltransferase CheR [Armatimonadota bacterium]MDR7601216.1 protein-glutamate O-methyltransferase CheR [Armatimonadota bacterium]
MHEYTALRQLLKQHTGLDLARYRPDQIERRLLGALHRMGLRSPEEFVSRARQDPALLADLVDRLTVHVSEFFRNPELFEVLQRRVLPELLAHFRELRVWSAGCSHGAEAYSVGILLLELDPSGGWSVLGTDIDRRVLRQAEEGIYGEPDVRNVSPQRRARFFVREQDRWRVSPELRRRVRFRRHDLLSDPFGGPWHLILCRNVVIYFTEEAKQDLYRRFHQALAPCGYLFVGAAEQIFAAREMGFEPVSPFFYRRARGRRSGA